jgi:hypothetical protein
VNWTEIKHLIFICSLGTVTTTTPVCTITDGMDSNTIIPSSEINVSDKMAVVDDLRPTSPKQLQSSEGTFRNDPDLVQAFLKKWWVESYFKVPNIKGLLSSFIQYILYLSNQS